MMKPIHLLPALCAALLFGACDSPSTSEPRIPAQMEVVSGDLQPAAVVGTELPDPLVVRVLDERGRPVRGQVVNFRVVAGNGSVFAGAAITDAQGEARERWTLGTVAGDTQRVEARAVHPSTGQALVFASFRAVATPDVPAAISVVGSAQREGFSGQPVADSLAAKVTDRFGNAVAGVAVTWSTGAGSGTVSPAATTTRADGVTKAQWTLGQEVLVPQTAQAAAGGASAQFTAAARAAFRGVFRYSGEGQQGLAGTPLPDSVAVQVRDFDDVGVPGVRVFWQAENGGSVSPAESITGPDGVARASWTLGPAGGEQRLFASAPVAPGSYMGNTFTATAVAPAPPGVSTDSARTDGSEIVVWGTVSPGPFAGTSWLEWGSQPDLSDAAVVGTAAYAAGAPFSRSLRLQPASEQAVYARLAAQNAYGTRRGQIVRIGTGTNFRARFDASTMLVWLEWDDTGSWVTILERQAPDGGWANIVPNRDAGPPFTYSGQTRSASDRTFDVKLTSAGPWRMVRCPEHPGTGPRTGCTTFHAPALAITPMPPPTNLQASVASAVHLTWQDNGPAEVEFMILRWNGANVDARYMLPANSTSYTDHEVARGGTYRYRVYALAPYIHLDLYTQYASRWSQPTSEVTVMP